jgi:peptide/nickel transport system permease protein
MSAASSSPQPGAAVDVGPAIDAADQPVGAWGMFVRNASAVGGLVVLVAIAAAGLFGPVLYGVDPFALASGPLLPPGSPDVPLGTDGIGRDILAGMLVGTRATLIVGATAAAITMVIGILVGTMAGFYGGVVDRALMRVTEFFQVLPALLLAMAIITLFSPTLRTIAAAIGVVSWTSVARLTRAEFLRIRKLDYVQAARAMGASNARIIWRVVLPAALPPLIVSATLTVGIAVLFESGLSFLGLSDPNVMSWGFIIGQNKDYMLSAWWAVTIPGIAIFATVLSVSLIGDGLNEAFNPKLRER